MAPTGGTIICHDCDNLPVKLSPSEAASTFGSWENWEVCSQFMLQPISSADNLCQIHINSELHEATSSIRLLQQLNDDAGPDATDTPRPPSHCDTDEADVTRARRILTPEQLNTMVSRLLERAQEHASGARSSDSRAECTICCDNLDASALVVTPCGHTYVGLELFRKVACQIHTSPMCGCAEHVEIA